jgi:hypothetical protein
LHVVAQCEEFKCVTRVIDDISAEAKRVRFHDSEYEITDAQAK